MPLWLSGKIGPCVPSPDGRLATEAQRYREKLATNFPNYTKEARRSAQHNFETTDEHRSVFYLCSSMFICGFIHTSDSPGEFHLNSKISFSVGLRVLRSREKKCIAGFQPAKVVLTQKELSRLRCRRDAGATIFSHDPCLRGEGCVAALLL